MKKNSILSSFFLNLYTDLAYPLPYLCHVFMKDVQSTNIYCMEKTCIQFIKEAATLLTDSKLQKLNTAKAKEVLTGVQQKVGLETMEEVYLFVAFFDQTCKEQISSLTDLADYFDCSTLDMFEYVPTLTSLEKKGLIVRRSRRMPNIVRQPYEVSSEALEAITENRPITIHDVCVEEVKMDKYQFCQQVADKVEDRQTSSEDIATFVEKMEKECPYLPFVKPLQKKVKSVLDRAVFYDMCCDNFSQTGEGYSDVARTLSDVYTNISEHILVRRGIKRGTHPLMKACLIELNDFDDDKMGLTDEGMKLFYGKDADVFCKSNRCSDIYDFIEVIDHDFCCRPRRCDSALRFYNQQAKQLMQLERENRHIKPLQGIIKMVPDVSSRLMFYSAGHAQTANDSLSLSQLIRNVYPSQGADRKKALAAYKDGKTDMQEKGLAELKKTSSIFGEDTILALTNKGLEMLFGEDAVFFIKEEKANKNVIKCADIAEKSLFFSNDLQKQLSLLQNSLDEEYYQGVRTRLEENHLPKGIAVLLYGEAGTGKTESVLQMAKATGRDILHVDISATKSCWFGESEKIIKKVFTDYRRLCEKSKVKPILLFNEADAIFSKRKSVKGNNVAQTENAIQNIILEEMENLDGILVATTNLADNLDSAFERRFLFKVRFDHPTLEAKKSIWKSKLPMLSPSDVHTLASTYELSGGQIDNIVRKALMQEVIKGERPTLSSLITMCGEEKIAHNGTKRVGFC